jgi:hypothetical protein
MANKKMGFEGIALYGVAGSTATNQLTNSRDITYNVDDEEGETTVRGNSSTKPIKTVSVTAIVLSIEITMLNDITDTYVEAMRAAAFAGTAVAIRTKDYSSGKGYDGDCVLKAGLPWPLNGEQVITFTCTPTLDGGRTPVPYT